MKKRVTLIWPPIPHGPHEDSYMQPNMGMAYLDAVLRDQFDVSVIDANIVYHPFSDFYKAFLRQQGKDEIKVWDNITLKLIKLVESTNPDFVGVGSWSYNMPFVAEFTRWFKARNPDIPIIVGGINPTLVPEDTLHVMPHVDYLVRGEGEYTFLELLKNLSENKSVSNVKGISFMKDNKFIHNPDKSFIKNLGELPFMDYENFIGLKQWLKRRGMNFVQVMSSRGCVAKCTFCSVYQVWKAQRFYPDEYIMKQAKHLFDLYDYKNDVIAFMDDNFVVNFKQTKKLIECLKRHFPDSAWQIVDMRVDVSPEEFLRFVSKKGCSFIGFGVESINATSLKFINKTITPKKYIKQVFKILDITEELNIRTMLSGILGLPTETEKDMLKQANFYINIYNKYKYASLDVCPLVIHPATNLWRDFQSKKIKVYKRPHGAPKRFYEGLYADRWDHLLFMVPNAYRIANTHMSKEKFEKILSRIYYDYKITDIGRFSREGLPREKQPLILNLIDVLPVLKDHPSGDLLRFAP